MMISLLNIMMKGAFVRQRRWASVDDASGGWPSLKDNGRRGCPPNGAVYSWVRVRVKLAGAMQSNFVPGRQANRWVSLLMKADRLHDAAQASRLRHIGRSRAGNEDDRARDLTITQLAQCLVGFRKTESL